MMDFSLRYIYFIQYFSLLCIMLFSAFTFAGFDEYFTIVKKQGLGDAIYEEIQQKPNKTLTIQNLRDLLADPEQVLPREALLEKMHALLPQHSSPYSLLDGLPKSAVLSVQNIRNADWILWQHDKFKFDEGGRLLFCSSCPKIESWQPVKRSLLLESDYNRRSVIERIIEKKIGQTIDLRKFLSQSNDEEVYLHEIQSFAESLQPIISAPLVSSEKPSLVDIRHIILSNENATEQAKILAENFTLKKHIKYQGRDFFVGTKIQGESRPIRIVYTNMPIESSLPFLPLLFYRSISDGGWRSSPGCSGGMYSKGTEIHYVQETKPVEKIARVLEKLDNEEPVMAGKKNEIPKAFAIYASVAKDTKSSLEEIYREQIKKVIVPGSPALLDQDTYKPGHIFGTGWNCSHLQSTQGENKEHGATAFFKSQDFLWAKDFKPDFTQAPERSYKSTHTILGNIDIDVFVGTLNGKEVEWHMAQDKKGATWIDRIAFKDCEINSWGNCKEVIQSGFLTSKPVEYITQSKCLQKNEFKKIPEFPAYVQITDLLLNLVPIKEYLQHHAKIETISMELEDALDNKSNVTIRQLSGIEAPVWIRNIAKEKIEGSYFYLRQGNNDSYQLVREGIEKSYLLPSQDIWVLQELVSGIFFGKKAFENIQERTQARAPHLWASEFSNVHTTFPFTEPKISVDGEEYNNSEAYFHAQKARDAANFTDIKNEMNTYTPDQAAERQRNLIGASYMGDATWNQVKDSIMTKAQTAKFSENTSLINLLLSTGGHPLAQVSNDSYWSITPEGAGNNTLGKILEMLRQELR